jgi:hypothetical protein
MARIPAYVIFAACSLILISKSADATPFAAGSATLPASSYELNLIEQAHGCHWRCRWGRVIGWHRHGRFCRPRRCY